MSESIKVHCSHSELVDILKLVEHPNNPNKHDERQVNLLARIINAQGWRNPITVSKRSGYIVAGHGRLAAAKVLNQEKVPVDYQDFENEADEKAHLLADNRVAELAELDFQDVGNILKELKEANLDLDLTGFDELSIKELFTDEPIDNNEVNAEPQIDKAEELQIKWNTALGQVWQLGNHRLICGDSTDADTVNKLMNGEVAGLMVTDPPYGVEYDASWRNNALKVKGCSMPDRAIGKVENDDQADWSDAWKLFDGDVAYVWHGGIKSHIVADSLISTGFDLVTQIIWAKNNIVIGRGNYHPKHEPCWYVVRKGAKRNFTDDRTQCTLWEIDKPVKSETGHSTQKPIECMARPIRNHNFDTVYDPFLGSGTTLIACENLNRICYGVELNPNYVAVILQRYKDATDVTPNLVM